MTLHDSSLPENMPKLLYVTEAAKVLRVSRAYAYRLVARGDLPCVRIGKSVRVSSHALIEFLVRCERVGQGDEPAA